jgi:hypothetical protein
MAEKIKSKGDFERRAAKVRESNICILSQHMGCVVMSCPVAII